MTSGHNEHCKGTLTYILLTTEQKTSKSFTTKLVSSKVVSRLQWCTGLFHLRSQNLHLLNLLSLLLPYSSYLSWLSLWMVAFPPLHSIPPLPAWHQLQTCQCYTILNLVNGPWIMPHITSYQVAFEPFTVTLFKSDCSDRFYLPGSP